MSKPCGQCGKPAVGSISEALLCLDCLERVENIRLKREAIELDRARLSMAMANHALAEMDAITGIPSGIRINIPPPPPSSNPVTFNNIRVDNSVVGAINTGNVKAIDVSLSHLHDGGNDKAKSALQNLTQATIDDRTISAEQKNELIEQIAFLSSQAAAPAQDRKSGLIKASLGAVNTTAQTVGGIATAWQAAEPILKSIFGW